MTRGIEAPKAVILTLCAVLLILVGGLLVLAMTHTPVPDVYANVLTGALGLVGGILIRPAAPQPGENAGVVVAPAADDVTVTTEPAPPEPARSPGVRRPDGRPSPGPNAGR